MSSRNSYLLICRRFSSSDVRTKRVKKKPRKPKLSEDEETAIGEGWDSYLSERSERIENRDELEIVKREESKMMKR